MFTIKCNKCGSESTIKQGWNEWFIEGDHIYGHTEYSARCDRVFTIGFYCKNCGNEVKDKKE
jgi:hypothetical protein